MAARPAARVRKETVERQPVILGHDGSDREQPVEKFDPTKNVLDLVRAESKYQDAMRASESKYQNDMRDASSALSRLARMAESKRIEDLATLRFQYDTRIAENLRVEVKTTSELISAQLAKETTSLSSQISQVTTTFSGQITALTATFGGQINSLTNSLSPRIADLERFRWEVGGKSSVSDPAVAETLARFNTAISLLQSSGVSHEGRGAGQKEVIGWITAGIMFVVSVAVGAVAFFGAVHSNPPPPPASASAPAPAPAIPPGYYLAPIPPPGAQSR
jgi:hypothetical protein